MKRFFQAVAAGIALGLAGFGFWQIFAIIVAIGLCTSEVL
jgi:hypothetical protein